MALRRGRAGRLRKFELRTRMPTVVAEGQEASRPIQPFAKENRT
jgi:hypothetical protein